MPTVRKNWYCQLEPSRLLWSHLGDRLYFRGGTTWKVADVSLSHGFEFQTPRVAFDGPYLNAAGFSYDVAPDGRAIVIRDAGQRLSTEIRLVTNWLDTERLGGLLNSYRRAAA